jgi:hypothetical protein
LFKPPVKIARHRQIRSQLDAINTLDMPLLWRPEVLITFVKTAMDSDQNRDFGSPNANFSAK